MDEPPTMYVITRLDLPPMQQVIQALHAAPVPFLVHERFPSALNVIFCTVKNEDELKKTMDSLNKQGIHTYGHYAPKFAGELTATASAVVYDRKPFRDLKLYSLPIEQEE